MSSTYTNKLHGELLDGKYTKWAASLTPTQLVGLLWLVGEFACRASPSDYPIDNEVGGQRRKAAALQALARFRHEPMGAEDVRNWIRTTMREGDRAAIRKRIAKVRGEAANFLNDGNSLEGLKHVEVRLRGLIEELADEAGE